MYPYKKTPKSENVKFGSFLGRIILILIVDS
jgi:hypothetical protein